jgi:hypothetical protein
LVRQAGFLGERAFLRGNAVERGIRQACFEGEGRSTPDIEREREREPGTYVWDMLRSLVTTGLGDEKRWLTEGNRLLNIRSNVGYKDQRMHPL